MDGEREREREREREWRRARRGAERKVAEERGTERRMGRVAGNISCTEPETVETAGKLHHAGSCDCRQNSSRECSKPDTVGKFYDQGA